MYFFNRLSSLELTKPRVMKFQFQPTARIGPNWPKLAQIGLNGLELARNDLDWPRLTQNVPKWLPIGPDWP